MRAIRYPKPKQEYFINCLCGAELAYTSDDVIYEDLITGYTKYVICPICNHKLRLDFIPHPHIIEKQEFYDLLVKRE